MKKRRKGTEKIEGNDEIVLDLSWIRDKFHSSGHTISGCLSAQDGSGG